MIFAFGVSEFGWRERFLLGTAFLSFLGVAGLYESSKIKAMAGFFEVKIATGKHGVVTFASADEREVDALLGASLRGRRKRLSAGEPCLGGLAG